MGIRITDNEHVCIYDSTSGHAFGPVFSSKENAESFLLYCQKHSEDDIRNLIPRDVEDLYRKWSEECLDNDGMLTNSAWHELQDAWAER